MHATVPKPVKSYLIYLVVKSRALHNNMSGSILIWQCFYFYDIFVTCYAFTIEVLVYVK